MPNPVTTVPTTPAAPPVMERLTDTSAIWRAEEAAAHEASRPALSVIVPTYAEPNIVRNIATLETALLATGKSYQIVVVVDGHEPTWRMAQTAASPSVTVIGYQHNRGKGFALRYGIYRATGHIVSFIDSDMEIDPADLVRMAQILPLYDADVVIASKRHPLSRVQYPLFRRLQSSVYQLLIRILFRLPLHDTQTGLKVMRRDVALRVLDSAVVKRFAFDLELLVLARTFGFTRILEVPVTIDYQFATTTNLRAVFRVLQDTAAIFYRLHITRYYTGGGKRLGFHAVRSVHERNHPGETG